MARKPLMEETHLTLLPAEKFQRSTKLACLHEILHLPNPQMEGATESACQQTRMKPDQMVSSFLGQWPEVQLIPPALNRFYSGSSV